MSSTTDTSRAAIAALATALVDGPIRRFVESRPADRPESEIGRELIGRGWQPLSLDDAEPIDPAGPVQLLIVDDPVRAPEVEAMLVAQSITPWLILLESSGTEPMPPEGFRHFVFDGTYDLLLAVAQVGLADRLAAVVLGAAGADASIQRWRASALEGWHARSSLSHAISANQELIAMRQTLSWRITRPLRIVRRRALAGQKR